MKQFTINYFLQTRDSDLIILYPLSTTLVDPLSNLAISLSFLRIKHLIIMAYVHDVLLCLYYHVTFIEYTSILLFCKSRPSFAKTIVSTAQPSRIPLCRGCCAANMSYEEESSTRATGLVPGSALATPSW